MLIPTISFRISCVPELQRAQAALRKHLTRVWPTRRVPLTPPAMAASMRYEDLVLDFFQEEQPDPQLRALVLFLPSDLQPHLRAMAGQVPRLRVQPDLNLRSQAAYVSWEVGSGPTPQAVWVEAHKLLQLLRSNQTLSDSAFLPLVLVSDNDVMLVPYWTLPPGWVDAADQAVLAASEPPVTSAQQLAAAAGKAEKYSPRPWLLMRYELRNGGQHLAVNWAPVQAMFNESKAAASLALEA